MSEQRYKLGFSVEVDELTIEENGDFFEIGAIRVQLEDLLAPCRVTNVTLTPVPESVTGRVSAGEVEHG